MAEIPHELVTVESLATYGGASGIVLLLTNTVRKLVKLDSPWVQFICSELIAFTVATMQHTITGVGTGVITFLNGCVFFWGALGMNETVVSAAAPKPAPSTTKLQGRPEMRFFSSWIRR